MMSTLNLRAVVVIGVLAAACLTAGDTSVQYIGICPLVKTASCPDSTYIKFYLYSRTNPSDGEVLDLANVNITSSFNAQLPTKILVHGLNGSVNSWQMMAMRREYMSKGGFNVLVVDWSFLGQAGLRLCLPTAARNAQHIGRCTAQLVTRLRTLNSAAHFHVIGFSMGGHVAAYVALELKQTTGLSLQRITGLDPYVAKFPTSDVDQRLDAGDAEFVDVVYTNQLRQWRPYEEPIGHANFYMNGGNTQPGCSLVDPDNDWFYCSHWRSVMYFSESINSALGFIGWNCSSFWNVKYGSCSAGGERSIVMGEPASPSFRGLFYVPTASKAPFALGK